MPDVPEVTTPRLTLRGFRAGDLPAHRAAVDDDAAVTWAHTRLPLADSLRRWADRLDGWQRDGFGMWVVEVTATGAVVGHAGLQRLAGTDEVELGYYLGRAAWGHGYATEAGRAALAFGSDRGLARVVAVVRPENTGSRHVLGKLGFRHDHDGEYYGVPASLLVRDLP